MARVARQEMEALVAADAGDEGKSLGSANSSVKPLHRLIAEHQDVTKLALQLNSALMIHRSNVNQLLASFSGYDELWTTVLDLFFSRAHFTPLGADATKTVEFCRVNSFCRVGVGGVNWTVVLSVFDFHIFRRRQS